MEVTGVPTVLQWCFLQILHSLWPWSIVTRLIREANMPKTMLMMTSDVMVDDLVGEAMTRLRCPSKTDVGYG